MSFDSPIVLDGISLPGLIQYVLDEHDSPSLMVVCGTKAAFLEQLEAAFSELVEGQPDFATGTQIADEFASPHNGLTMSSARSFLKCPTLRILSTSKDVNLIFCPDITHLRALLARQTLIPHQPDSIKEGRRILVILNLLQLHRPTSAFSVQGVNRTFSVAVEAAHHTNSRLVLAECTAENSAAGRGGDSPCEVGKQSTSPIVQTSVWDEEVSILNVTTKSFRSSERGWVGRTVKLRTIAERWCIFKDYRALAYSDNRDENTCNITLREPYDAMK